MNTELPRLQPRAPDSHKGVFGRVLLIGGSRGMPGSISLSGMAALRSGAGLVTLAVPQACQAIVAGFEPSYMAASMPDDSEGRIASAPPPEIRRSIERATGLAIGP